MAKVKNFFKKVGLWFKNHAPSKRRLIQLYAALLVNANIKGYITGNIYTGKLKNLCSPGLNCYSCPGASFACPLGALQDSMAQSGDRAGFYIIGILALFGLTLARTICGFLCPVGLGQELLHKIKTPKLKKSRYTRVMSFLKYIILAVMVIAIPLIYHGIPAFCKYICPAGTFEGAVGLLSNSNNTGFFAMLGNLFTWKFCLLVFFIVGSIFVYRFFCRFFCPLGAIYGFFNKWALIGVKLDESKCVDCGMCIQTCKMDIKHVGDHECINCGECVSVCPTQAISWKGSKIFVKGAQISPVPAAETASAAPLASVMENGSTLTAQTAEAEDTAPIRVFPEEETAPVVSELVAHSRTNAEAVLESVTVEPQPSATAENASPEASAPAKSKRKVRKDRNFWLRFSAWAAAIVVLIGALVYYNFLDVQSNTVTYAVGDRCPDITLKTYKSAGTCDGGGNLTYEEFSTMESRGTVTVINFWYTTCDPCVAELPYFEKVRAEFGEQIIMVAVHSATAMPKGGAEGVQSFINSTGWNDYGIVFAQDTQEIACYKMLGGSGAYPTTVIIDKDGYISYFMDGPVEEEELREEISKNLNM